MKSLIKWRLVDECVFFVFNFCILFSQNINTCILYDDDDDDYYYYYYYYYYCFDDDESFISVPSPSSPLLSLVVFVPKTIAVTSCVDFARWNIHRSG